MPNALAISRGLHASALAPLTRAEGFMDPEWTGEKVGETNH